MQKSGDLLGYKGRLGFARNPGESLNSHLWRNLVAAYAMSLGNTGQRIRDISGRGNHGTASTTGANIPWVIEGEFGPVPDLTMADQQHFKLPLSSSLDITGSTVTMAGWVFQDANAGDGWARVCAKEDNAGTSDVMCMGSRQTTQNFFARINGDDIFSSLNIPLDTWTHLAVTYDGAVSSTTLFYSDGILVDTDGSVTGNIDASTKIWNIGGRETGNDVRTWPGRLDHIYIWDRVLFSHEIRQLYNDPFAIVRPKPKKTFFIPLVLSGLSGAKFFNIGSGVFHSSTGSKARNIRIK